MDIIKTSGGTGSPGYVDDNAPNGGQWKDPVTNEHLKVPEGTKVQKTGNKNDYEPAYFLEINILDGLYAGTKGIWVKNTHVITVEDPVEPPPTPEGDYAWQIDVVASITVKKVKIEG
jgi:hypothetical protein